MSNVSVLTKFLKDEKESTAMAKSVVEELKAVFEQKKRNVGESCTPETRDDENDEGCRQRAEFFGELGIQDGIGASRVSDENEMSSCKNQLPDYAGGSHLTELQQALCSRKLSPCVCFTDEPD